MIFTLIVLGAFLKVKNEEASKSEKVYNDMLEERQNLTNVKKNLTGFNTRILSHIKASPAGFAKILTNSEFYDHFRFDIAPSTKEQVS